MEIILWVVVPRLVGAILHADREKTLDATNSHVCNEVELRGKLYHIVSGCSTTCRGHNAFCPGKSLGATNSHVRAEVELKGKSYHIVSDWSTACRSHNACFQGKSLGVTRSRVDNEVELQ